MVYKLYLIKLQKEFIKKTKKNLKCHKKYCIMHSDKGVREEIHTQSVSFWHLFVSMETERVKTNTHFFQGMVMWILCRCVRMEESV